MVRYVHVVCGCDRARGVFVSCFFVKQRTAYEMRTSDWSSDVCSSDLVTATGVFAGARERIAADRAAGYRLVMATASYRFYVGAIAERLGFDDEIGRASCRERV